MTRESTGTVPDDSGGDSETIAAIAGGMAEALYGIPASLRARAVTFPDGPLLQILQDFEAAYPAG